MIFAVSVMNSPSSNAPTKLLFVFLVGVLLIQWGVACFIGFRYDEGYYLPMARAVWEGFVPFVDFPSHYPPLSYYMLAILGPGVSTPVVVRLYLLLLAALCGALIFWILREEGNDVTHSSLLAVLFMAWTACLDTKWVALEVFQNLFLLASWLALVRWPTWKGIALGGIALGASLMVKQYALLAVPGLALLALSARHELPWRLSLAEWRSGLVRVFGFGLFMSLPFAVFVVLTGQDFLGLFWTLSTWGGEAVLYSRPLTVSWLHQVQQDIMVGHSSALLFPAILMFIWWMWIRPNGRALALGTVLVFSFLPQIIRGNPHNFALMVPWAVLVVSGFTREVATQLAEASEGAARQRIREWLIAIVTIVVVPLIIHGTLFTIGFVTQKRFLVSTHAAVAKQIRAEIPNPEDVLVIFHPWMYLVADFRAPDNNYTWPDSFGWKNAAPMRDAARHVVLMPAEENDMAPGREFLLAGGMELFAEIPSPWQYKSPIQLFRWPDGRRPSR